MNTLVISTKLFYKIIHLFIGVLFGILALIFVNSNSQGSFVYPLCLSLLLLCLWCVYSWKKVGGNLFNPYILFLASLSLFNGGQAFLEVFGLNEGVMLYNSYNDETLAKTLLMVNLSIYMLHLGALFAVKRPVAPSINSNAVQAKALRIVGLILFGISIVSFVIMTKEAISLVLSYGYFGLYSKKEVVTGFSNIHDILSAFLVPSALFMLAGSKNNRRMLLFSMLLIAMNTFIQFFLGSRTYAAMPLIAYVWLYDTCIKRIPRTLIISGSAFLLIVVFPLLHEIRNASGVDKFSIASMVESYFSIENPIIAIFKELGGSMGTVAATISVIPFPREFDYGSGYFYALLTTIPNLFWEIHPSVAHGTYALWISMVIDPIGAALGYGQGFSAIAESYVNFGWFGIIVFFFIGYGLVKFFYQATLSQNLVRLAMVAVFLSYFLFFARSESSAMVRPLLWYAFLPYMMYFVLTGGYKRKQKTAVVSQGINGKQLS